MDLLVMLLVVLMLTALAQGEGPYDLSWHTIDGGGGRSSGGSYRLSGTIGQPDAGEIAGGDYELLSGFWAGGPMCYVGFDDFARFSEHWLETNCSELNGWCGGADLDRLGDVDFVDLGLVFDEWLNPCPVNWSLR